MAVVAMPLTAVLVLHLSTPPAWCQPSKCGTSSGSVMRGLAQR
jgi:hypothetical protein